MTVDGGYDGVPRSLSSRGDVTRGDINLGDSRAHTTPAGKRVPDSVRSNTISTSLNPGETLERYEPEPYKPPLHLSRTFYHPCTPSTLATSFIASSMLGELHPLSSKVSLELLKYREDGYKRIRTTLRIDELHFVVFNSRQHREAETNHPRGNFNISAVQ